MDNFLIADEFFLITHDKDSGKPLVSRDLVGAGLIAALIGELVLDERATVEAGRVTLLDEAETGEAASDFLVKSMASQTAEHSVRTWVQNLGEIGYELITRRLVERGTLRRVRPRRVMGRQRGHDVFPAADREAVEPGLWLSIVVVNPEQADTQRSVLAGLLAAAGGERLLPADLDRNRTRSAIGDLVAALPPNLADLVASFREAVVTLSLSTRR